MPQAVFLGLSTLDVVHARSRALGANEKARASAQFLAAGGPAANAAVTAAALGIDATLITALGDHPLADIARNDMRHHGVHVIDVVEVSGTPPLPLSLIRLATASAERSVSSLNDGALAAAVPLVLPAAALDVVSAAEAILFDGYYPDLARSALASLPDSARIVLDVGSFKDVYRDLAPRANIAAASADASIPGAADPALGLLALGADTAVITAGAEPIRVVEPGGEESIEPPAVAAIDTLGAGDAFHGALLAAALRRSRARLSWQVDFAARVASLRTTVLGPRAWLNSPTIATFAGELSS